MHVTDVVAFFRHLVFNDIVFIAAIHSISPGVILKNQFVRKFPMPVLLFTRSTNLSIVCACILSVDNIGSVCLVFFFCPSITMSYTSSTTSK